MLLPVIPTVRVNMFRVIEGKIKATSASPKSKLTPLRERERLFITTTNMKNDDIRALAFGQYIHFLYYKLLISINLGKRKNVEKPAEDPPWWP